MIAKVLCRLPRLGPISDQPQVPLAWRRTGVKIASGTARDVVFLWCGGGRGSSDAGSRSPKGPFIVASSMRVSFFRSPPVPGRYHLARIDQVNEEIDRPTGVIEQLLAPYEEQLQQAGGVCAGIDWATADHVACVVDMAGRVTDRFFAAHDKAGITALITRLRKNGADEVAIERGDDALVDALLAAVMPLTRTGSCANFVIGVTQGEVLRIYLLTELQR